MHCHYFDISALCVKAAILDCGGKAERRHRFCAGAMGLAKVVGCPKAPSSPRIAGAVHDDFGGMTGLTGRPRFGTLGSRRVASEATGTLCRANLLSQPISTPWLSCLAPCWNIQGTPREDTRPAQFLGGIANRVDPVPAPFWSEGGQRKRSQQVKRVVAFPPVPRVFGGRLGAVRSRFPTRAA